MKGFLFDENLPTQLKFSLQLPVIPVIPASMVAKTPPALSFGSMRENTTWSLSVKTRIFPTGLSRNRHHRVGFTCGSAMSAPASFRPSSPASGPKSKGCSDPTNWSTFMPIDWKAWAKTRTRGHTWPAYGSSIRIIRIFVVE